jgi:hypothetical protein
MRRALRMKRAQEKREQDGAEIPPRPTPLSEPPPPTVPENPNEQGETGNIHQNTSMRQLKR